MRDDRTLSVKLVMIETMEQRRLLAGEPWGALPQLIRQDTAAELFPGATGAGTSIAIIDTGVDYNQPALGGGFGPGYKVVAGHDFVDGDEDPMDTFGHGTNVAGVIGASPFVFDEHRFQGIAPGANLIALRVDAADDPVPPQRIQAALQWVIGHRAEYNIVAVNISFGEGHYSGGQYSLYSPELRDLHNSGVVVCAASGNDGVYEPYGIQYPAADPSVFSVGAVDSFDRITEYSARGANLDFLAPGDSVATTTAGPLDYDYVSGTSFASPATAGAVALIRQVNPDLNAAETQDLLRISGIDNLDGDNEFGSVTHETFPRLDLTAALRVATAWKVGPWSSSGQLGATTEATMAYDGAGVLHTAYYDPAAQTLMYAVRLHNRALSVAQPIDVSGDNVGQYLSLAIDALGRPAVSYFDGTTGDLKYANFNGSSWDSQTIDSRGSVGLYSSLAFQSDGHAIISYYNKSKGDLRIAEQTDSGWSIMTLDGAGDVGRSTSLAIDSATGDVAIAYEHSSLGALKVATRTGNTWGLAAVDQQTRGVSFISVAFDQRHLPAVSYYNAGPADLKYAASDGTQWQTYTLAKKGAQGLYSRLTFSGGKANIFYYNRRNDMLVWLSGAPGEWTATPLISDGGKYVSLAADGAGGITYSFFRTANGKMFLGDV